MVGADAVGTAIAHAAQIRGVCRELALFDLNADKVRAEVLDLNHRWRAGPGNSGARGRGGVESVLATPLSADERDQLGASAETVPAAARDLGP